MQTYQYNAIGAPLPYGGETVVLTLTAPVNAGVLNSIKIGVADVGDSRIDSAVFIQAGSFTNANHRCSRAGKLHADRRRVTRLGAIQSTSAKPRFKCRKNNPPTMNTVIE